MPSVEKPRIAIFVCNCAGKIAEGINTESLTNFASSIPGVTLAQEVTLACQADDLSGIASILKDEKINRVVFAACSKSLHERTFRDVLSKAGLNPHFLEIVDIREGCAWIHSKDRERAVEKSRDMLKMGVARVSLLSEPEVVVTKPVKEALVIGAGVSGLQAALDLSKQGIKVHLVERAASLGGMVSQISSVFPSMQDARGLLDPLVRKVTASENITLYLLSEVENISGAMGNFHVKVRKKALHVNDKCTACGECASVCPVITPDEYNLGLKSRRAIFRPAHGGAGGRYVIDMNTCLGNNPLVCSACMEACTPKAIDFDLEDEIVALNVGSVVLSTGMDPYDPGSISDFGYKKYTDILTSLELERLLSPDGPTNGNPFRISDMRLPNRIGFVLCVGSRSPMEGKAYCSNICCMTSIKQAIELRERMGDAQIIIFYLDLMTNGKGYDELYQKARQNRIIFVRGLPSEVSQGPEGTLIVSGENTLDKELYSYEMDMVVLSVGMVQKPQTLALAKKMNSPLKNDDFFPEEYQSLPTTDIPRRGVFLAGSVESPKDIRASAVQSCAVASRVSALLAEERVETQITAAEIEQSACVNCLKCITACPFGAIEYDDKTGEKPRILATACRSCGLCLPYCDYEAILLDGCSDNQVFAQLDILSELNPHMKSVLFACGCAPASALNGLGSSHVQCPPGMRVMEFPCAGRISEKIIIGALRRALATVSVIACPEGECCFVEGNGRARETVERVRQKLEEWGLNRNRVSYYNLAAREKDKAIETVTEIDKVLRQVDLAEIGKTRETLASL